MRQLLTNTSKKKKNHCILLFLVWYIQNIQECLLTAPISTISQKSHFAISSNSENRENMCLYIQYLRNFFHDKIWLQPKGFHCWWLAHTTFYVINTFNDTYFLSQYQVIFNNRDSAVSRTIFIGWLHYCTRASWSYFQLVSTTNI